MPYYKNLNSPDYFDMLIRILKEAKNNGSVVERCETAFNFDYFTRHPHILSIDLRILLSPNWTPDLSFRKEVRPPDLILRTKKKVKEGE